MSTTPVILRGNYSDLFGSSMLPVLEEMFRHELTQHPMIREQLAKKVTTDKDIWQSSEMGDLQNLIEVAEGTDYTYVAPRQGASKTFVIKKYGLGFTISEEAVADGKFEFIAAAVKMLAESALETQEVSVLNLFNNGFTSAVQTRDGVNLFSTSHTLPSGLTFRNKASSDADLSQSSLDAALVDYETQFIRDSGKIIAARPSILLVPPQLKRYAMELVGSDLKPDSNDNNMNSLKQDGLRVVSSPRLTDSDAWFLLPEASKSGLRIISRTGIETKAAGPDQGFDNDSIKYKTRYREIVGALDAQMMWGSSGA